ncbi:7251_t:CDS:2 [Funneliformis mosseae]|uniref:7251_t:CDS:1 n=1 Tax=Funneliformis mosseae TaxID=27381 RepID=A0A9N9AJT3_FUNMO|nr:7251_t:CDS:2 [Funneliformis mosseae]
MDVVGVSSDEKSIGIKALELQLLAKDGEFDRNGKKMDGDNY